MAGGEQTTNFRDRFNQFAKATERASGSPWAFCIAAGGCIIWGLTGSFFSFSDSWQMVANTVTTIITFLMVFAIQNSQHRETAAIHLKLDELLRAHGEARNQLITAEEWSEDKLESERDNLASEVERRPT